MTKLTFQTSEDTRLLIIRLEKAATVGEIISYADLSATIGKPIQANRGALATARKTVLVDRNFVFGTERGIGLKRLSDDEIIESTTGDRKSIRGKATRSMRKLNAVEYLMLSKTKQIAATAIMAVFNAARVLTREHSVRQLASVANSQKLNFQETLNAFRRSPPAGKEE